MVSGNSYLRRSKGGEERQALAKCCSVRPGEMGGRTSLWRSESVARLDLGTRLAL